MALRTPSPLFRFAASPLLALALGGTPGSPAAATDPPLPGSDEIIATETTVVDTAALTDMNRLIEQIADRRVVFVGETHDRYEDHLNQLAIVQGLHERNKDLAIGMEFFQQPFQSQLDAYIAGEIDEAELLRATEYFDRWRFDYRLYRPILRFAREHGIPLVALNLPKEITDKAGDQGIASLTAEEAAQVPAEIDRGDVQYRNRIKKVFDMHPQDEDADFEHFLDVQLLWDEGMAERAAEYLRAHPGKAMVVLAGVGHVEYGRGIPRRVARRLPVESAILVNGTHRAPDPAVADYILYPRRVELPATGMLGVMLDTESEGEGLGVQGFASESGAQAAGVKEGDRIVRVGDELIASYADIRIALMDSRPGQELPVEVLRKPLLGRPERLQLQVELH